VLFGTDPPFLTLERITNSIPPRLFSFAVAWEKILFSRSVFPPFFFFFSSHFQPRNDFERSLVFALALSALRKEASRILQPSAPPRPQRPPAASRPASFTLYRGRMSFPDDDYEERKLVEAASLDFPPLSRRHRSAAKLPPISPLTKP